MKAILLILFSLLTIYSAGAQGLKAMKKLPPDFSSSESVLVLQLPEDVYLERGEAIRQDLTNHGLQIVEHYNLNRNPSIQKKQSDEAVRKLEGRNVSYQITVTFTQYSTETAAMNSKKNGKDANGSVIILVVPVTADLQPSGSLFMLTGDNYEQAMARFGAEVKKSNQ